MKLKHLLENSTEHAYTPLTVYEKKNMVETIKSYNEYRKGLKADGVYETAQKIKPEGVSRSRMVYPGDFLLSNSMSFGRPYIMKTEGCIHDGWLVLRDSKGELDQDFLFYLLGSRFMYEKFSQLAAGSTVQNLNSALVSSVEIPVPPIDFQKRIAEKARMLEENVARLNEVNQLRLQAAKDLRQSILEAAFAGDL